MSGLERLARRPAACLSAHGKTDWRRFIALAHSVGAGRDPASGSVDRPDEDTGAPLRVAVADAAFLRRILLGLVAAAMLSGGMTVVLWAQTTVAT